MWNYSDPWLWFMPQVLNWPREEKLQKLHWATPKLKLLLAPNNVGTTLTAWLPFRNLSWVEMQAQQDKGLYYNCDEKFAGTSLQGTACILIGNHGKYGVRRKSNRSQSRRGIGGETWEILTCFLRNDLPPICLSNRHHIWLMGGILIAIGYTHNFVNSKLAQKLKSCLNSW